MGPQELSYEIRRIAAAIDRSERPSRHLIARDLNAVLQRLAFEEHEAGSFGRAVTIGAFLSTWMFGMVNTIKKDDGMFHAPEFVEKWMESVVAETGVRPEETVTPANVAKTMEAAKNTHQVGDKTIMCDGNTCRIIK